MLFRSAAGSNDPDGNRLTFSWYQYPDAGAYAGNVDLKQTNTERVQFLTPAVRRPETVHIILEVRDDGAPNLVSYRRAILTIRPPASGGGTN